MRRLFAVSALILSVAIVLNSCSGGGGGGTPYTGPGSIWGSLTGASTTTISGTVTLSSTVAGSSKPSGYQVTSSGSVMDKVSTAAGIGVL